MAGEFVKVLRIELEVRHIWRRMSGRILRHIREAELSANRGGGRSRVRIFPSRKDLLAVTTPPGKRQLGNEGGEPKDSRGLGTEWPSPSDQFPGACL